MESPDAAVSVITDRLRQSAAITEAMSAHASDIARAAAIATQQELAAASERIGDDFGATDDVAGTGSHGFGNRG